MSGGGGGGGADAATPEGYQKLWADVQAMPPEQQKAVASAAYDELLRRRRVKVESSGKVQSLRALRRRVEVQQREQDSGAYEESTRSIPRWQAQLMIPGEQLRRGALKMQLRRWEEAELELVRGWGLNGGVVWWGVVCSAVAVLVAVPCCAAMQGLGASTRARFIDQHALTTTLATAPPPARRTALGAARCAARGRWWASWAMAGGATSPGASVSSSSGCGVALLVQRPYLVPPIAPACPLVSTHTTAHPRVATCPARHYPATWSACPPRRLPPPPPPPCLQMRAWSLLSACWALTP